MDFNVLLAYGISSIVGLLLLYWLYGFIRYCAVSLWKKVLIPEIKAWWEIIRVIIEIIIVGGFILTAAAFIGYLIEGIILHQQR